MNEKLLKKLEELTDKEFWDWVRTWNDKTTDKEKIMQMIKGWHEVIVEMELDKLEGK